jgi:hypothetical protein
MQMRFTAVQGSNYARYTAPTSEQTAKARGYTAAQIGGENPYDADTLEHEAFAFAFKAWKEYEAEKAANGGRWVR